MISSFNEIQDFAVGRVQRTLSRLGPLRRREHPLEAVEQPV